MKNRDRVQAALHHEPVDRCPMQVSFTPEFATRLRQDMGEQGDKLHNPHGGGNTYALERALDQDLLLTSVGWANSYYQVEEPGEEYRDEWGIVWRAQEYETRFGKGIYTEVKEHPLADDNAIDSYVPPDPNNPALYAEAESVLRKYQDDYFIVGVTVTTIFETAWALRGLETVLTDMVENPALTDRLLDIPFHFHLSAAIRLAEMGVDMIWTGDDIGGQHGMIISPDCWRRYFKPRMAVFYRTLKEINPDIKIAYHSDGDIFPIVEDLIEIGLDVLNPIQPACMDPARVKELYGDRLCFWGSIDEQYTLPFGSADEVRDEVRKRLDTIGRDGGLILGPTHHVQLDTPLENFWAMVETITGHARMGHTP